MKQESWVAMLPYYLLAAILVIGIATGGSRAVTTALQTSPVARSAVIVIDAGHGGMDGGAISCTGIYESKLNLEIAQRLNDLMHFLGYETVMIRSSDTSVHTDGSTIAAQKVSDLKERVRIVNQTENALLISIHQNTFSDSRYGGAQVFYAPGDTSRNLANALQSALVDTLNPGSARKCKKAENVYLMQRIEKPGVLIECGFLSNPEEEAKLRTESYQKKLAGVIAASVSSYLKLQRISG